jgi:MFS family permease
MAASKSDARISLLPILTVNFIGTLGFSIVLPFLVFLVTKWGGNALIFGLAGATYSVFQLIGAPILGRWSDSYGRRKILLLSQIGTLLSWVVLLMAFALPTGSLISVDSGLLGKFSISLPLILLFVARAADGLTGGNVSVANAYLADITTDERRNEDFGKMAASANLGFIIGPFLAGVLGATALAELPPVIAATLVSLAASIVIWRRLPESNACVIERSLAPGSLRRVFGQEQKNCYKITGAERVSFRRILELPHIVPLLTIYLLIMLAFNFFYVAFPVFVAQQLAWEVSDTGVFFAVTSALMVLVQGPVLKRLSRRFPESKLMIGGGIVLSFSFLCFVSYHMVIIYVGALLLAVGNGLMWSSLTSVISNVAGSVYQGAVQGLAGSIGAVASIAGLLLGGLLYDFLYESVFVIAAICIAVSVVVAISLLPRLATAVSVE